MPRGYLKNTKGESRKCARGGGSHPKQQSSKVDERGRPKTRRWEDCVPVDDGYDNIDDDSTLTPQKKEQNGPVHTKIGECSICYERRPVVTMSKVCSWHDAACCGCLRQVHVTNAQKSCRNFPLQCFHPLCSAPVHTLQLMKHRLIQSEKELTQHYRMTEMSKGKDKETAVVHCPHCDHPRTYRESKPLQGTKHRVFTCRACKENYIVSPLSEIIQAMINFGEAGPNDEFAQCPQCQMLILKECGDDDMWCSACSSSFSWDQAKRQSPAFKYPFARPGGELDPIDQLHLYW